MSSRLAVALIGGVLITAGTARSEPAAVELSIDEAFALAGGASEDVAVSRAGVARAEAGVTSARSNYLPQVTGSGAYVRTLRTEYSGLESAFTGGQEASSSVVLPFGQANTWRVGLSASQLLLDFGRTTSAIDAARAGEAQADLTLDSSQAQATLDVAAAYYDAALADRQVAIAEIALDETEETLAHAKLAFEQETGPEYDVVRAEVSRDNQRTALIDFRAQQRVAQARLARLVGLPIDQPIKITSPLDGSDLEGLTDAARDYADVHQDRTRTAIVLADEVLRMRRAQLRGARAARWPIITVASDLGFVAYPTDPFPADHHEWRTNWTVGVTLSVPLFDGLRTQAEIRSAEADVAAANAQLRETRELSELDELQTDTEVETAQATWKSSARTVEQAKKAYEIAVLRFDQGESSHVELVDARLALEQSALNQARSARDLRVALVRRALLAGLPLPQGGAP